jgi:hypothetical protein
MRRLAMSKHFLIIYDRSQGELLECREYVSGNRAMTRRFKVERLRPDLEVVVLSADSLDTVKQTHSRYFSGRP